MRGLEWVSVQTVPVSVLWSLVSLLETEKGKPLSQFSLSLSPVLSGVVGTRSSAQRYTVAGFTTSPQDIKIDVLDP